MKVVSNGVDDGFVELVVTVTLGDKVLCKIVSEVVVDSVVKETPNDGVKVVGF